MTWRRRLRALLIGERGRRRPSSAAAPALRRGWHAQLDDSALRPGERPCQGALGDCWLIAPLLCLHELDPALTRRLWSEQGDGTVAVTLFARGRPVSIQVDRTMPMSDQGRWMGAHGSLGPGWPGLVEKAAAVHVAGSYPLLAVGLGSVGLTLLTGQRCRLHLRLPDAARLEAWIRAGHGVVASTHPLSPLVRLETGALRADHVYAVVGADATSGDVLLRDPGHPDALLRCDRRRFRLGFVSAERTLDPLRSA